MTGTRTGATDLQRHIRWH